MVQRYTTDGTLITQWETEKGRSLSGISVNKKDEVFVTDTVQEQILKYTDKGVLIERFRGPHNEVDGAFHPVSIDINLKSGQIYIAAILAHRIDMFTKEGTLIKSIKGHSLKKDILNDARNIAIHPNTEDVFTSSRLNHAFHQFSHNGEPESLFLFSLGELPDISELWKIKSIAKSPGPIDFDSAGNLWAIRTGGYHPQNPTPSHILRKYKDGVYLNGLTSKVLEGRIEGMAIHKASGDFFITLQKKRQVVHLDVQGNVKKVFGDDVLKKPGGIAIDEKRERLYIGDMIDSDVKVFTLDGIFLDTIGEKGREIGQLHFTKSVGIEVDNCGLIYVTEDKNRRVSIFSPKGYFQAFLILDDQPPKRPKDVAVNKDIVYVLGGDMIRIFQRMDVNCSL
jgi:DNA-binding beta-propeller fold protein YncE